MGDPHGDPQTSPQHADPHGLSLKRQEIHVDQRILGWSAGRHVGGNFRHGLPEKSLIAQATRVRILLSSFGYSFRSHLRIPAVETEEFRKKSVVLVKCKNATN